MTEQLPFTVPKKERPRLNVAKLGEAGIGAGVAAVLVWGLFESNFEHTADLQRSYIELLQEHHSVFIKDQREYHQQVATDMGVMIHNLDEVVDLVATIQNDQRSWALQTMGGFTKVHP